MSDTPLIYIEKLCARVLHFNVGEGLPVHSHPTERHNHITLVLSGSLKCHGRPAIEGQIIKAGDILDWIVGEPHGFTALEDNTSILQINKGSLT